MVEKVNNTNLAIYLIEGVRTKGLNDEQLNKIGEKVYRYGRKNWGWDSINGEHFFASCFIMRKFGYDKDSVKAAEKELPLDIKNVLDSYINQAE